MNISIPLFKFYSDLQDLENTLLIIENKKVLYNVLKDIGNGCIYEEFIELLDDNNRKQKINDHIDFIPSVLTIDVNNKKNINSLLKLIKKCCEEDIKVSVESINKMLRKSFEEIRLEIPIEIIEDIDVDNDDYLKILGIKIFEDDVSLLERINTYIKATYELRSIKIFVFYGLFTLLEENEVKLLLNTCQYYDIKIINIENIDINTQCFIDKLILDKDICLLK